MKYVGDQDINIDTLGSDFEESFSKIWYAEAENDKFNALIIEANLCWYNGSFFELILDISAK